MATIDDVARICLGLPDVAEGLRGQRQMRSWSVGDAVFAWERPLSKADVRRLGSQRLPEGDIVAIHTDGMAEKAAIMAQPPPGAFDIEHFANYPAYLIELGLFTAATLRTALLDGWLAKAPTALAQSFLADQ